MKFVGLCSSLAVVANGKPQNVEQFYSDYFQDNNQQDQVASDIDGGVQADTYDEYTDYGSGSGDFERDASDIAENFMHQSYDIPSDIPVILLRQMLINSGYHEHMTIKRRRRQAFYQDNMSSDHDYDNMPNYDRYVDYGTDHVPMFPDEHTNEEEGSGEDDFGEDPNAAQFRGGIQQNFDITFDDNSMDIDTIISYVINHGCWCPKIEGHEHHEGKPLDEMDKSCQHWSKCIHCTGLVGGCASTDDAKPDTFNVIYTGSEYYCNDEQNSACAFDLCQCSLDWAVSLKTVIDESNASIPNDYQNVSQDMCHVKRQRGQSGGKKKTEKHMNGTDVFLTPDDNSSQFRGQMDLIC